MVSESPPGPKQLTERLDLWIGELRRLEKLPLHALPLEEKLALMKILRDIGSISTSLLNNLEELKASDE